jgi:hypothetical protein
MGLYANTIAMHEWADRWLIGKGNKPLILRHKICNEIFQSELVCNVCEQALKASDVSYDRHLRRRKAG